MEKSTVTSELGFRRFLGAIIPDVTNTLKRFPVEMLLAVTLAAFLAYNTWQKDYLHGSLVLRISLGLIGSFLWMLAVSLRAQKHRISFLNTLLWALPGLFLIAMLHAWPRLFEFHYVIFLPALVLMVGLLAYIGKEKDEAAFWLFNHRLWIGAGLALVGAVLFSGGLAITVWTVEELFSVRMPSDTWTYIWIAGLAFVLPVAWMSFIPRDFEEPVPEGRQIEPTSAAVAILVKFILIPLLLILTTVLYAYAFKIAFFGGFIKGLTGPLVLAYGAAGTVAILFLYPTRNSGGPLPRFFWRFWFMLTIVPLVVLAVAVYQRVTQYGITVDRYVVWMAGLWLAFLAVMYSINRENRNFRLIIGVLGIFLVLASFGPWGARGISVRHQASILKSLLENNELLKDGKVLAVSGEKRKNISASDLRQIRTIVSYIAKEDSLNVLTPLFANSEKSPLPFSDQAYTYMHTSKLLQFIGVNEAISEKVDGKYVRFYGNQAPRLLPVNAGKHLFGPVNANVYGKSQKSELSRTVKIDGQDLSVEFSLAGIDIKAGEQKAASIDISSLMANIHKSMEGRESEKQSVYVHEITDAGVPVTMVVVSLTGYLRNEVTENYNIEFWLMLGDKK